MMGIIQDIERCRKLAHKQAVLGEKINQWFVKRYGRGFSDADCDPIIDVVDYGQGQAPSSIEEIDKIMLQYCEMNSLSKSKGDKS